MRGEECRRQRRVEAGAGSSEAEVEVELALRWWSHLENRIVFHNRTLRPLLLSNHPFECYKAVGARASDVSVRVGTLKIIGRHAVDYSLELPSGLGWKALALDQSGDTLCRAW